MESDDPEKRIADLEHQVAEQKRIADLERQLAEAKAAAGQYDGAQQPPMSSPMSWGASGLDSPQMREAMSSAAAQAGMSQAQLDEALRHANVTIKTGHSTFYPGMNSGPQAFGQPAFSQMSYSQPAFSQPSFGRRRSMNAGSLIGGIVGLLGGCVGAAAALTAVFPSTALWTSSIVCGAPNQLMVNTSHYSYKPGQSGTNVDFQCLQAGGAKDASFLAIGGLQFLLVLLVFAGLAALGYLLKRLRRGQGLKPVSTIVAGALGLLSVVVLVAFIWQAVGASSGAIQMPQGGSLTVKGNGETKTIACNDGHLTVNGRDETVTVTGHCSSVSVDGVIHHVTIDSADTIDVDGVHNVVTYHSGAPNVTDSGMNSVKQG
jgi:Protein of unknown function (DUF3060)